MICFSEIITDRVGVRYLFLFGLYIKCLVCQSGLLLSKAIKRILVQAYKKRLVKKGVTVLPGCVLLFWVWPALYTHTQASLLQPECSAPVITSPECILAGMLQMLGNLNTQALKTFTAYPWRLRPQLKTASLWTLFYRSINQKIPSHQSKPKLYEKVNEYLKSLVGIWVILAISVTRNLDLCPYGYSSILSMILFSSTDCHTIVIRLASGFVKTHRSVALCHDNNFADQNEISQVIIIRT